MVGSNAPVNMHTLNIVGVNGGLRQADAHVGCTSGELSVASLVSGGSCAMSLRSDTLTGRRYPFERVEAKRSSSWPIVIAP